MTESARTPNGLRPESRPSRAGPQPRGPSPSPLNPSTQQATSTGDVAAATQALRDRGISTPERLVEQAGPDAVLGACRWFDAQNGRVGTGVLVNEVRSGSKAGWTPTVRRDAAAESAAYQRSVWDWLATNMPDLCDEDGLASPHAVAAVFRWDMVHGKGSLDVGLHGQVVRDAVRQLELEEQIP